MTKKPTYPTTPPTLPPDVTPDMAREVFSRNLQRAMDERRMIASDLSRKSGVGKDNISKYLRAKILPKNPQLIAIAHVLKKTPEELLPVRPTLQGVREHPPLDIRDIGDGNCWVRVNQAVPAKLAYKILGLLSGLNGDQRNG